MHHTTSDGENGNSANFWEPNGYSRTVKRAENASKLCSELAQFIHERSEIEKAYSNNLRKFAARLETFRNSGLEYGTCADILSGLAKEAEDCADIHHKIASDLILSVHTEVKNWQKENFHKGSISSSIKEVKSLDIEFENAQKTWYKQYKLVSRWKKAYFNACKAVRSQQVQVQNAKNEPFGTPEQQSKHDKELRKMEDKLKKASTEEEHARESYEQALNNLNDVNPKYVEDMTRVFTKAQDFEKERVNIFKQQALQMHDILDISAATNLSQIFADLKEAISRVDADADVKNWSIAYGADMAPHFPNFEEYTPDLNALQASKKKKKKKSTGSDTPHHNGVPVAGVAAITMPDQDEAAEVSPRTSVEGSPIRHEIHSNHPADFPDIVVPTTTEQIEQHVSALTAQTLETREDSGIVDTTRD